MAIDFVSFGNIFIDDIVLPDGRTFMATPGGAGTHALVGMRVWATGLGFVAYAGPDFPESFRAAMQRLGVDLQGIVILPGIKTTRAWQLFDDERNRTEVFRTKQEAFARLALDFEDIPADYFAAKGYHLYWAKTVDRFPAFVDKLRERNPQAVLVWEPAFHHDTAKQDHLRAALPHVTHFSPDLGAACAMTGAPTAEAALEILFQWGAPSASIRMGAAGSLVGTAAGERWRLAAVPADLVDVTGAGNAYCGGLVVSLAAGLAVVESGLRASVSASFALEQFGIPAFAETYRAVREERLHWARANATRFA